MFDLLIEGIKGLGPWPPVQLAAIVIIIYAGLKAMALGERDRKTNGNGETTPRWFANEQTLDLLREIRGELHQIKREARLSNQHLEQIANENLINPRRLQE